MKKWNLGRRIRNLWRDFPVPAILSMLLCGMYIASPLFPFHHGGDQDNRLYDLMWNAINGLMVSLCLSAALSAVGRRRWPFTLAAVLSSAAVIALQMAELLPGTAVLGIVLFSIALGAWAVCRGPEETLRLNQVAGWFFACVGVTAVLVIALTGIAAALNSLFFSDAPSLVRELIDAAALTLPLCLVAPWLFLGGVRECRGERFRWVNGRLLLPLYLALMAVLLAYVGKMLVTWEMPVGTMNGFALAAAALYVFFHLTLDEGDGRIAALFRKWGAWAMLPVLAAQAVGVYIRVAAYGLTADRLMGVVAALLCAGAVATGLMRRRAGWFLPVAACVALALPLAADHAAILNQEHRLTSALERNQMLTEAREITPNPETSPDDQRIIWDAADYLLDNDDRADSIAGWIRKTAKASREPDRQSSDYVSDLERTAIWGFERPLEEGRVWIYLTFQGSAQANELDVADFSHAKQVSVGSNITVNADGTAEENDRGRDDVVIIDPLQPLYDAAYASPDQFALPETTLTVEIGGENCDLAPLFSDLAIDPKDGDYLLTNDRITLPSGKVLHIITSNLYVSGNDGGGYSGSFYLVAWLLTPEAE